MPSRRRLVIIPASPPMDGEHRDEAKPHAGSDGQPELALAHQIEDDPDDEAADEQGDDHRQQVLHQVQHKCTDRPITAPPLSGA